MGVASIKVHPTWNIRGYDVINSHDIAVLELTQSHTDLIPICLPSSEPSDKYVGRKAVAAGFGNLENNNRNYPRKLMKTDVKILSIGQCNEWWWRNPLNR